MSLHLHFGCSQEWSAVNVFQYVSVWGKVQDTSQNWCLQIVVTESIAPASMENKVVSY